MKRFWMLFTLVLLAACDGGQPASNQLGGELVSTAFIPETDSQEGQESVLSLPDSYNLQTDPNLLWFRFNEYTNDLYRFDLATGQLVKAVTLDFGIAPRGAGFAVGEDMIYYTKCTRPDELSGPDQFELWRYRLTEGTAEMVFKNYNAVPCFIINDNLYNHDRSDGEHQTFYRLSLTQGTTYILDYPEAGDFRVREGRIYFLNLLGLWSMENDLPQGIVDECQSYAFCPQGVFVARGFGEKMKIFLYDLQGTLLREYPTVDGGMDFYGLLFVCGDWVVYKERDGVMAVSPGHPEPVRLANTSQERQELFIHNGKLYYRDTHYNNGDYNARNLCCVNLSDGSVTRLSP